MARGQEVFSKIEPSFVLGRSEAGMRFAGLSTSAQLCYLRLWNRAVETRSDEIPAQKNTQKFKSFSKFLGYSQTIFARLLSEIYEENFIKRQSPETYKLLGVKEKHGGLRWKTAPNGERTGTERAPNAPRLGQEVRGKSITTPQTPQPQPQSPTKEAEGKEILFKRFCRVFPAVRERGITRQQLASLTAGMNGKTETALATLVEACADSSVKHPPAVVTARMQHQPPAKATLTRVHAALHPPRDRTTCHCGGEMTGYACATGSGKKCDACGMLYPGDTQYTER